MELIQTIFKAIKKIVAVCITIIIISTIGMLIFIGSADMAKQYSITTPITDPNEWLQFAGTFFGVIVSIAGAFFVMQWQLDASKKEKEDEEDARQESLNKLLKLLLGREIERNWELFEERYLPRKNTDRALVFGTEYKFQTVEWQNLKYVIVERFAYVGFLNLITEFYYEIEKTNARIDQKRMLLETEKQKQEFYDGMEARFEIIRNWLNEAHVM